jgi:hypothetical protein
MAVKAAPDFLEQKEGMHDRGNRTRQRGRTRRTKEENLISSIGLANFSDVKSQ